MQLLLVPVTDKKGCLVTSQRTIGSLQQSRVKKKGGKGGAEEEGRGWCREVALGNHEACVNLNRDSGKSPRRLCVCVQVCGCVCARGCFQRTKLGRH